MPVHFSLKASDSYDGLYYLAEFVVVSRHLAFDMTRLRTFPSPHPVSKPPQRSTPQPLLRFGSVFWMLLRSMPATHRYKAHPYALNTHRVTGLTISND